MPHKFSKQFKDIIWAGRVRPNFQAKVWAIAIEHGYRTKSHVSGNMMTSCQTQTIFLLDGDVSNRRGYFDGSCGMRVSGNKALQFILYELGEDPSKLLLHDQEIWPWTTLKTEAKVAVPFETRDQSQFKAGYVTVLKS